MQKDNAAWVSPPDTKMIRGERETNAEELSRDRKMVSWVEDCRHLFKLGHWLVSYF